MEIKYLTWAEATTLMSKHDWHSFPISKDRQVWYKKHWFAEWNWNNVTWHNNYAIGKLTFVKGNRKDYK